MQKWWKVQDLRQHSNDCFASFSRQLQVMLQHALNHLGTLPKVRGVLGDGRLIKRRVVDGRDINPARSLGAAIVYNRKDAWDDQWIFWVGPFVGAALAAVYHQIVIRAIPFKTRD